MLLLEGLAVHQKLFRIPLVDRDRRLALGWYKTYSYIGAGRSSFHRIVNI
jgi:hypothetical protein